MKKILKTDNAPKPIGPYNQAVIAGDYMFISGQIALNPKNGKLITDDINKETNQVMAVSYTHLTLPTSDLV